MNHHRDTIARELRLRGNPAKAEWWNTYMRGVIPFYGVGIPEIRNTLRAMDQKEGLSRLPMNRQVGIVNGLIKGIFAEEKLAAILYLQLFWLEQQRNEFILNLVSDWFDDRYIGDWNTTDWLCVKVLTPMIDSGDREVIRKLGRWSNDPYVWKARASLVPFAQAKTLGQHCTAITRASFLLIRRPERFAKTAVGWVMREYSKIDEEFVLEFLSKNVKYTTAEVKKNALKYYRQRTRT